MNDDQKEMLKNLDLLMNMDLVENEADWDAVQNMDEVVEKPKLNEADSSDELKLDEE